MGGSGTERLQKIELADALTIELSEERAREIERLKQDIEIHMTIANNYLNEAERLRSVAWRLINRAWLEPGQPRCGVLMEDLFALKAELTSTPGANADKIGRLRALLAEIASLPAPNPAKELAARGLCDE